MFVVMIVTMSLVRPEWYTVQQHGPQHDTLAACQVAAQAAQATYTPPEGRAFQAMCSRRWYGQDSK